MLRSLMLEFQKCWGQLTPGSETSVSDSVDAWEVSYVLRRRRMVPGKHGSETKWMLIRGARKLHQDQT